MLRTAHNSPKLKRLKRRLQIPQYAAVGLLESLWHMTATQAQRGDIGKWDDADIASQIEWEGDEGELIAAFVECGWLDEHPEHRLVVHDWHQHADTTVKRSPQVRDKGFASDSPAADSSPTGKTSNSDVKDDTSHATDSRLACESHASDLRVTLQPEPEPEPVPEPEPDSCAEAAAPPSTPAPVDASEAFIFFPLVGNGGGSGLITHAMVEEWEEAYPGVDVPQQLRSMRQWLIHNPKNRKTANGLGRFVTNWLAKEQNRSRPTGGGRRPVDNSGAAEEAARRIAECEGVIDGQAEHR